MVNTCDWVMSCVLSSSGVISLPFSVVFFFVYACKHLYIYVKLLMKYLWKSYPPGSDIWSSIFFLFLPLSLFSLGWKSNLHFYLMIQCKLEVITSNLNKCIEKSTCGFFYHWYDLSHLFQFDRGKVIIQRILNQIRTQFR